jgi:DNA (cytosine-5)-methyltransferase 1
MSVDHPRLLDLFCGAGGAGEGYRRAGFDVTGVDNRPMPRNPHTFIQADALEFVRDHGHEYDVIHASPPCQAYTTLRALSPEQDYPELIEPVRKLVQSVGVPYVIENVPGAPLHGVVMLCGSMFGLDVRRHRWFESNVMLLSPPCAHHLQTPRFRHQDKRRGGKLASVVGVYGHVTYAGEFGIRSRAMGIDWMTPAQLSQAIPPAYTEFIGHQLFSFLASRVKGIA